MRAPVLAFALFMMLLSCDKEESATPPTPVPPPALPPPNTSIRITTMPVDSITKNCVISGGKITEAGNSLVAARGVCWNTSSNPTAALVTKTKDGTSAGEFSSTVYGLQPGTTYFLRAYVITGADTIYGQEVSFTTTTRDTGLVLGQKYAGGLIFYLDATKEHGLVCAPRDVAVAKWGCELAGVSGTSVEIGKGAQNTKAIVTACPEANYNARICDTVVLNFYEDWYMPSRDELELMYVNLHKQGKGRFGIVYHSSTEFDTNSAWAVYFAGNGVPYNLWKGASTIVRPVRAF